MKCPVCDVDLSISAREGVEIDFCPQCRGVWLDRGELDKIIDRVAVTQAAPVFDQPSRSAAREPQRGDYAPPRDDDRHDDDRHDERSYPGSRKKKKRAGFLEDLFDFG